MIVEDGEWNKQSEPARCRGEDERLESEGAEGEAGSGARSGCGQPKATSLWGGDGWMEKSVRGKDEEASQLERQGQHGEHQHSNAAVSSERNRAAAWQRQIRGHAGRLQPRR